MIRALPLLAGFLASLLPAAALAQGAPAPFPPCGVLPGCGGTAPVLATSTLPQLAIFMVKLAGGLSVIFIILAGLTMLTSWGDTGKISKAKWAIVYSMLGLALAIGSQMIVGFTVTENFGQGNTGDVVFGGILPAAARIMVTVVNAIFAITIIIAGIVMAMSQGKTEEFTKGKTMLTWAIGGAIIVNLARALVTAVTTFFGI